MSKNDQDKEFVAGVSVPWSVPVAVAQIPETGLERRIEANATEREAVAKLGGLLGISSLKAALVLKPVAGGTIHVAGRVQGRVGQSCVVTLEPIDSDIDEEIDLIFAPPSQIRELAESIDEDADRDEETPDPPEPIENGFIDLGKLATDALFLGIDPYPRKPGAVFDLPETPPAPEDHPFAALKALKGSE